MQNEKTIPSRKMRYKTLDPKKILRINSTDSSLLKTVTSAPHLISKVSKKIDDTTSPSPVPLSSSKNETHQPETSPTSPQIQNTFLKIPSKSFRKLSSFTSLGPSPRPFSFVRTFSENTSFQFTEEEIKLFKNFTSHPSLKYLTFASFNALLSSLKPFYQDFSHHNKLKATSPHDCPEILLQLKRHLGAGDKSLLQAVLNFFEEKHSIKKAEIGRIRAGKKEELEVFHSRIPSKRTSSRAARKTVDRTHANLNFLWYNCGRASELVESCLEKEKTGLGLMIVDEKMVCESFWKIVEKNEKKESRKGGVLGLEERVWLAKIERLLDEHEPEKEEKKGKSERNGVLDVGNDESEIVERVKKVCRLLDDMKGV